MSEQKTESLLSPFRALDLTNEKGFFCGKMLGDLGADVIKIEKPGGDPARSIGPFYHDIPDPEKSLYWFAFNTSKRGVTLNIETADGQGIFKRLVKNADFVIESFAPGYMDNLGLGYSALSEINPRIIMTSITPFGQTGGPYKDYKSSDFTLMALGGYMYITGDPDRAPVRISFPQSYIHAGAQAAGATMIAHYNRGVTGEGQYIDVSIFEVIADLSTGTPHAWWLDKRRVRRGGRFIVRPDGFTYPSVWPCRDGFIIMTFQAYVLGGRHMGALVEWMDSEGKAPDFIKVDWTKYNFGTMPPDELYRFLSFFSVFFLTHTKAEFY